MTNTHLKEKIKKIEISDIRGKYCEMHENGFSEGDDTVLSLIRIAEKVNHLVDAYNREKEFMTDPHNKESWEERFIKEFPCIQSDCDGTGHIPYGDSEVGYSSTQCEFHAKYLIPLENFIRQLLSQTREDTLKEVRNRIIDVLGQKMKDIERIDARLERAILYCLSEEYDDSAKSALTTLSENIKKLT